MRRVLTPARIVDKLSREAELALRRREGRELLRRTPLSERVPEEKGYLRLDGSALRRFGELRELGLAQQREREGQPRPEKGKDYFIPLLTEESYRSHPQLVDAMLDRNLLALATDYIGSLPILKMVQFYWTPSGDGELSGSQLFHLDRPSLGERQLKLFVNLSDVQPEDGPFTFVPADASARIASVEKANAKRYTDEQIYRHTPPGSEISLVGPPGTAVLCDTNRCLHYGARSRGKGRLLLIAQYVRADLTRSEEEYVDLAKAAPRQVDSLAEHALRPRL